MGKSKLRAALAAEKGTDFKKLKEKRKHKDAVKRKQNKSGAGGKPQASAAAGRRDNEEDWEDEEEDNEGGAPVDASDDDDNDDDNDDDDDDHHDGAENLLDIAALNESDSDSGMEFEEKIERKPRTILKAKNAAKDVPAKTKKQQQQQTGDEDDEEEDEEEDEEDIPMSDIEELAEEDREDLIPHSRLTINNTSALLASLHRIALPTDKSVPFASHQSVVSEAPTAEGIEDIQDDLKRELALYAQSLDAAKRARALLRAEGVPFSRPTDYFAEMVKDDGHMDKVKAKLVEEASAKKASADARKQRDLKKFGKQVQVAKLQERQKAKRDTLEKIKSLKRKRSESGGGDLGTSEADLFDVGVESELKKGNKQQQQRGGNEKAFGGGGGGGGGAGQKRQKKNEKYGFGGKKRHAKSNDAASSGDLSGFNARRMKSGGGGGGGKPAKTSRLGKSRRNAGKR